MSGERLSDADFGYPAWRGFVEFAADEPEYRQQFTAETGLSWPKAARSPLDAMIDDATGHIEGTMRAFVVWISREWGLEHCPPEIRDLAVRASLNAKGGE